MCAKVLHLADIAKSATHKHFFTPKILSTEKFCLLLQPKKGVVGHYVSKVEGYRPLRFQGVEPKTQNLKPKT